MLLRFEAALEVEHFTYFGAASDELVPCRFDVVDDQERSLDRARRGRHDFSSEDNRAR
jgi:hypothetical protein